MEPDDAWLEITKITNKERMTQKDVDKARRLKQYLRPEEKAWLEEALFLIDRRK